MDCHGAKRRRLATTAFVWTAAPPRNDYDPSLRGGKADEAIHGIESAMDCRGAWRRLATTALVWTAAAPRNDHDPSLRGDEVDEAIHGVFKLTLGVYHGLPQRQTTAPRNDSACVNFHGAKRRRLATIALRHREDSKLNLLVIVY